MFIVLIILFIVLIYFIYLRYVNTFKLRSLFKKLSIVVCGKRGKGKDVTFSYVARNIPHNSNIILQPHTNLIKVDDLIIPNLSRDKLVSDTFDKVDYVDFELFDNITFISDAGIYFPNWDESKLKYVYKELPITWAIWRHLYDNGCHFNLQKCGRLWKLLREQIEDVLEIESFRKGLFYFKISYIHYERVEDAEKGLLPLKKSFLKRRENIEVENSKRGSITRFSVLIPKRLIKHNSRYFKDIVFKGVDI